MDVYYFRIKKKNNCKTFPGIRQLLVIAGDGKVKNVLMGHNTLFKISWKII